MSEAAAPVISLTGVTKEFRARGKPPIEALRGVDLAISRGAMVAIKGPSGSGKTTLLHMIGALDVPTAGEVEIDGTELTEMTELELTDYRARTIGFVFQAYHLIPNLTARENVALPMEILAVPASERRARAETLLEEVGMQERADSRPAKLSGGEQQRVAIARALANTPTIILADEPTGNLDSRTGGEIMNMVREFNRQLGMTVVMVTHEAALAERYAERLIFLADGKVVDEEVNPARAATIRGDRDAEGPRP